MLGHCGAVTRELEGPALGSCHQTSQRFCNSFSESHSAFKGPVLPLTAKRCRENKEAGNTDRNPPRWKLEALRRAGKLMPQALVGTESWEADGSGQGLLCRAEWFPLAFMHWRELCKFSVGG